ncbi:MAG: RHS repeat protein [Oligoflexia bacterium]|nr:RHS repeat protein [Oligoflexia bacterium]
MKFLKLLLTFLFLSSSVFAGVNLKNGNYYISYTDIIVPGNGHDLEVVRTYNSKSTEKGWFGFGWGSDYETYLTVSADGSVIVHENGSGALTRFTPKNPVDAKNASKKIVEAMRKKTTVSDKVAADLIKKLTNDAELRQAYARKFKVKAKISVGSKLFSNTRGLQRVEKSKNGYVRIYNDGKKEYFSDEGKLVRIQDKHGYKITLDYNKQGRVAKITDTMAKQLFFDWYPDGKVKHISSVGDKKTTYKYKGDDLVESKDIAGNVFKYGYDANHNMTSVSYSDGSKMTIAYTPKTQFVKQIVGRNKEVTSYEYDSHPKNPEMHYWTTVSKKTASGKASKSRYEYEIKSRADGSTYTYRIATDINGLKTETIYSECCGLPLKITRGNHKTDFVYNEKGLLTSKTSSKGDFVKLEYHKKFNKISKVTNKKGTTQFQYDKNGNLSVATNKEKKVLLVYDSKGRIKKMLDQSIKTKKKRTLEFKYNALGKPVEISMAKVGKINVAYDNYGEIKKVESKAGHKMALQVTQAFQSLLSIVKPAGVNLNM